MIRPLNRNIFQSQLHPPYATVKLTKRGYKITQKNQPQNQPQIKKCIQLTDKDKATLEALSNRAKTCKNNEQE